ncbi:MAG: hypothetical protein LC808_02875 [Actinobacteria bacterium]|nr:hypothetical protein [Actinomycetota bacterium]
MKAGRSLDLDRRHAGIAGVVDRSHDARMAGDARRAAGRFDRGHNAGAAGLLDRRQGRH